MKKKLISVLLLALMCLPLSVSAAETKTTTTLKFVDVKANSEEYDAVLYLFEKEIMNGKSKTQFCPQDNLKREEFAKILTKAFDLKEKSSSLVYGDVADDEWYASFAKAAGASGLMIGVSEDRFGVGMELSRQDLAVVLKRFLDKNEVPLKSDNVIIYADNNEISDYAKEAVSVLSSSGIIKGKENNMWHPKENITRADAAVAVYNALKEERKHLDSLGLYGGEKQYYEPYDVSTDDRIAESMPVPFDANLWPTQEFASIDFESDDYGVLKKESGFDVGVTIGDGLGFDGSRGLKMDLGAAETILPTFTFTTKPGELDTGDFLVITAKVKIENSSVIKETKLRPLCKPMVTVWDDEGNYLTESDKPYYNKDTDGWEDFQAVKMIPEKANDENPPEYFKLGISAYGRSFEKGTAYFDDIKVGIVRFEPMSTVLMTPNYKGIIKGENGVGDIALRAYINDKSNFYNHSNLKYTAQITDNDHNVLLKTESDVIADAMDVYFSSATLPMGGDYYLESILTYKDTGEVLQNQEWTLHKREADFTTVVDFDKYGRVVHNGVPKLPISVYGSSNYTEEAKDVIDAGCFDILNNNGFQWYTFYNDEAQKMVKDLEENDVSIVAVLGNTSMASTTGEVTKRATTQLARRGLTEKKVNNLKDLPNLFAYYNFDEQNGQRFGREFAWMRKIVENLDLDHPTICAIDKTLDNYPGIYASTSDFLGYDSYPITGNENQTISSVTKKLEQGKKANPNRPYYYIIQGFYYDTRVGDLRAPTETEFRNMAYQGVIAGACMLDMYSLTALEKRPDPTATKEELWERYTKVFKEINSFEPIILSTLPAPYYKLEGDGEWIKTMAKRYNGKSYLFAVNVDTEKQSAKIYLDDVETIKGLYSGKTYQSDKDGWFEIDLEKYETEVFEFEQADYKSSHAELKRFGLSECVMIDSEEEVPTFIVSADKTEVEYNAAISDFAKLYINGKEKEVTGKIDISGLSEMTIKVASEDGRFDTERTYKIEKK